MFKIEKFSEMIGVSSSTLRRWGKSSDDTLLKPFKIINKYRYYSYQQYVDFVGKENVEYDRDGSNLYTNKIKKEMV